MVGWQCHRKPNGIRLFAGSSEVSHGLPNLNASIWLDEKEAVYLARHILEYRREYWRRPPTRICYRRKNIVRKCDGTRLVKDRSRRK